MNLNCGRQKNVQGGPVPSLCMDLLTTRSKIFRGKEVGSAPDIVHVTVLAVLYCASNSTCSPLYKGCEHLYRDRYYPYFQASVVSLGMYHPWKRGGGATVVDITGI